MGLFREAKLLARGRDWRGRSRTPRSAEPFAPRPAPREFPTAWARTPAAGAVRTVIQRGLLKPVVWSQTAPQVSGLDLIEGVTGPVIFIANHASHLDAPLILGSLPRRFTRRMAVGAAADYFFDARWRASLTALVFNAFPVERQGSRRLRSLAPRLLDEGWNLLLFPEGTRSQDGWMNPFRLGTAQLCCTRGVAAVPLALRGSFAAMPRGRNWPRPDRPRVALHYGRPVRPEPTESMREFNDRLAAVTSRLWVEEDLGWYQSLRAQAEGTIAMPTGPTGAGWRRVWESTRPLSDGRPTGVWEHRR